MAKNFDTYIKLSMNVCRVELFSIGTAGTAKRRITAVCVKNTVVTVFWVILGSLKITLKMKET